MGVGGGHRPHRGPGVRAGGRILTAVPVPEEAVARGKAIMFINPTGVMDRKAVQTLIEMTQSNLNVDEFYALFDGRFLKD